MIELRSACTHTFSKGSRKKFLFLMAGPLRGVGGVLNGCATKEKRTFFNVRKKVPVATKPRGALVAGPLRKNFFAAFLRGITKNI